MAVCKEIGKPLHFRKGEDCERCINFIVEEDYTCSCMVGVYDNSEFMQIKGRFCDAFERGDTK